MPRTTRKSSEQLEVPAAQKRARPGRPPALNHEDCAFILHKLRLWQVRDPLWIHHEPGHAKAEALAAALRDQRGVKVKQRTIYNLCFATGAQQIPGAPCAHACGAATLCTRVQITCGSARAR